MASCKYMRALRKESASAGYTYSEDTVSRPQVSDLKPGEALIRWEAVAICGSDIPLWKWDEVGQAIAQLPFIPGHECCGEVVALNLPSQELERAAIRYEFAVGDRVCAETHLPCLCCFQCRHDRQDICSDMGLYGHGKKTAFGGCAEYGIIPVYALYKLRFPDKIGPKIGAILEPFGVAHNALSEAAKDGPLKGETVTILGAGPIGVFATAIAHAWEAAKIIVVDVLDNRLEMATRMGATSVINSSSLQPEDIRARVRAETENVGTGVLIECTGAPSLVNSCFSFRRKGGRCVLVGLPKAPLHIDNVLGDLIFRAITVRTIHGRRMYSTWEACEELIASGRVDLAPVITHEYGLSEYQQAFHVLLAGQACKVIIYPGK